MSTMALSFQILALAHKNREEKVKPFKVNQKEEKLTVPPRHRRQNFDQAKPAHKKIQKLEQC